MIEIRPDISIMEIHRSMTTGSSEKIKYKHPSGHSTGQTGNLERLQGGSRNENTRLDRGIARLRDASSQHRVTARNEDMGKLHDASNYQSTGFNIGFRSYQDANCNENTEFNSERVQYGSGHKSGLNEDVERLQNASSQTIALSKVLERLQDALLPQRQTRNTNFSIDEILKPDFGKVCRVKSRVERMKPSSRVRSWNLPYEDRERIKSRPSHGGSPISPTYQPQESYHKVAPADRPIGRQDDVQYRCPSPDSPTHGQITTTSPTPPQNSKLEDGATKWPAWVYCTRYSDRPSAGPRSRKSKAEKQSEEKRPRTAFTTEQLQRLKEEFEDSRYLSEARRQELARHLGLSVSQIKIWFQNKRAKLKKTGGTENILAKELTAQGLYNHKATSNSCDENMDTDSTSS